MEIRIGNSCGSCIHSNRPKQPREHAAHYEVAKTERWCYKHNCHITRETTCDDHEGISRAAKTSLTRTIKFNQRQVKVLEVIKLLGDKKVIVGGVTFYVRENWLRYKYNYENQYSYEYSVKTKEGSTDKKLEEIIKILTNTDPL